MAMIDGTRDATANCRDRFLREQSAGRVNQDTLFEAREAPTDLEGAAIRVVAVYPNGNPIPGTEVDGIRTVTDSTRLAPLGAKL